MNISKEKTTQHVGNMTFEVISHYGKNTVVDMIMRLLERESLKYMIHTNDKAS